MSRRVARLIGVIACLHCAASWVVTAPPRRAAPPLLRRSQQPVTMLDAFVADKLESVKRAFNELTAQMGDPEVAGNPDELTRISKERAALEETVEAFDRHRELEVELEGAKELFNEAGDDADMREMAREEQPDIERPASAAGVTLAEFKAIKVVVRPRTATSAQIRWVMNVDLKANVPQPIISMVATRRSNPLSSPSPSPEPQPATRTRTRTPTRSPRRSRARSFLCCCARRRR